MQMTLVVGLCTNKASPQAKLQRTKLLCPATGNNAGIELSFECVIVNFCRAVERSHTVAFYWFHRHVKPSSRRTTSRRSERRWFDSRRLLACGCRFRVAAAESPFRSIQPERLPLRLSLALKISHASVLLAKDALARRVPQVVVAHSRQRERRSGVVRQVTYARHAHRPSAQRPSLPPTSRSSREASLTHDSHSRSPASQHWRSGRVHGVTIVAFVRRLQRC